MSPVFELKKTANQKFIFNLKAANQEIVLTSELYATRRSVEDGIGSVARNAVLDDRYLRKTGADGKSYFLLLAGNNLVIGRSEMYSSQEAMERGIAAVKRSAPNAHTIDLSTPVVA